MSKPIIKMSIKTVNTLRSIVKDKGICGYYKLKKADLIALLLEQSTEEMSTPPPRGKGKERRSVPPVKIIPNPQGMDEFEKEEMKNSRLVVKNKLNEWYDWLVDYIPKPIKNGVSKAFLRWENSILWLYDGAKKTLKGDAESEARKENQKQDVDLTPHKH